MTSWHHPYLYIAVWCIGTVLAVYVLAAYVVAPRVNDSCLPRWDAPTNRFGR